MVKRLGLWATWYQHNIQGMKGNVDRVSDRQRFDQSCLHNETSIKSLHISRRDTPGVSSFGRCWFVSSLLQWNCICKYSTVSSFRTEETAETLKFEASWPGLWVSGNPQICSCCLRWGQTCGETSCPFVKFGLSLGSHLSHHELVIADLFNLVVNAIRIDPEVRFFHSIYRSRKSH